jgi:hypothetical protein
MPAIYGAFNNDDSPIGRALTTAAHLMLWGIALHAALRIPYYLGYGHWAFAAAGIIGFVPILCGILHHHLTRLCVRCMAEVPPNASSRAEREKRVLWLNHLLWTVTGTLAYCGLIIGTDVLVDRYELPRWAELPADLVVITYMYSVWLHHKLRPWCPYCRNWGDDGGILEPSPDPVIKATR